MGSFIWLSCQIEENIFMQCLCFSLFLLSIPLQVVNDDDNLIISLWLYFPVERKARWSCSLSVFLFLSKITGPFCLLLSKSERRQNFNFQQGLWKEGTGLPGNVFVKVIWGWADTLSPQPRHRREPPKTTWKCEKPQLQLMFSWVSKPECSQMQKH